MALLNDAATWLPEQLQTAAGKTATYTRRAKSETLTVVVGQVAFLLAGTGQRIEVSDRDFLILVSDFEDAGFENPATPQKGDRIQVSGESAVYEVLTPPTGDQEWRYTDGTETEFRVHCMKVR